MTPPIDKLDVAVVAGVSPVVEVERALLGSALKKRVLLPAVRVKPKVMFTPQLTEVLPEAQVIAVPAVAIKFERVALEPENVPALNGLGLLFVEAIARRDYTLTQALVLLVSSAFIVVNFLMDVMYAWLDPRIRIG